MTAVCFPEIPSERRFKLPKILRHLGINPVDPSRKEGDIRIWISNVPKPDKRRRGTDINGLMVDSTKRLTSMLFELVFGYGYEIYPPVHSGIAVEKSDVNGRVHGHFVTCPMEPKPRMFYSRFLTGDEWRVQFFGRYMCVTKVYRAKKDGFPESRRIPGSSRHNVDPMGEFETHELVLLGKLAKAAGMDYGGMDVIRDKDGKIYVIDLNPGPSGPYQEAFPPEDWPKVIPVEAELFKQAFLP